MEPTFDQQVGLKLTTLRKKKKLSVTEAAKGAGVSFKSLYRWEDGQRSMTLGNFKKLCDFFGKAPAKVLK